MDFECQLNAASREVGIRVIVEIGQRVLDGF